MRLYLDTEFNGFGGSLISLALVSEDGKQSWYETTVLPCELERRNDFDSWVYENVLPKLGKPGMPTGDFRESFQAFVKTFHNPEVVCDWHADALHFCYLLQGHDYESSLDLACRLTILKTPPGQPQSKNPHNALADAEALRVWHQGSLR